MNKKGNKVRFSKRGCLYVEIENIEGVYIVKVENPFEEKIPEYVEISKYRNVYYVKGYEPNKRKELA